jgi:hypothetical protein
MKGSESQTQKGPEASKSYTLPLQVIALKNIFGIDSVTVDSINNGIIPITIVNPENPDQPIQLTATIESDGKGVINYGDCYAKVDLDSNNDIKERVRELTHFEYINLEQYQSSIEEELLAIDPNFDLCIIQYGGEDNLMTAYFEDNDGYEFDITYTKYLSEPRITMIISKRTDDGEDSTDEYSGNKLKDVLSYL